MTVARTPSELERKPRAVAVGTFDGVHTGHRHVLRAALDACCTRTPTPTLTPTLTPTVVTFDPHPREVFGYQVELISSLERRLDLLAEAGIEDVLVVEFTEAVAQTEAVDFAESVLRAIGAEVIAVGAGFRFGHARRGDVDLLRELGFDVRPVPLVEGVSSSTIRKLVHAGEIETAARLLGRPVELDGVVVHGDARGGILGFPTANLRVPPALLVPAYGIYAGWARGGGLGEGRRAAISIGTNPHYGGDERRVEAFLLDFDGDLYGERLVVEVWRRLRDEAAFESERALVDQIGRDVDGARAATRPV